MLDRLMIGAATTALALGAVAPDAKAWWGEPYDGKFEVICDEGDPDEPSPSYVRLETFRFDAPGEDHDISMESMGLSPDDFRIGLSCNPDNHAITVDKHTRAVVTRALKNVCDHAQIGFVETWNEVLKSDPSDPAVWLGGAWCDTDGETLTTASGEVLRIHDETDNGRLLHDRDESGYLTDATGNLLDRNGERVFDEAGEVLFDEEGMPREPVRVDTCSCWALGRDLTDMMVRQFEVAGAEELVLPLSFDVEWERNKLRETWVPQGWFKPWRLGNASTAQTEMPTVVPVHDVVTHDDGTKELVWVDTDEISDVRRLWKEGNHYNGGLTFPLKNSIDELGCIVQERGDDYRNFSTVPTDRTVRGLIRKQRDVSCNLTPEHFFFYRPVMRFEYEAEDRRACTDVVCDDGDECTMDSCNIVDGSCISEPVEDSASCGVGICQGVICDDGNDCTVDRCSPVDGSCISEPVEDDMACSVDGEVGVCAAGECEPEQVSGTPEDLAELGHVSSGEVELASGPDGTLMAVWLGDGRIVSTSRYTPGEGWSAPELISEGWAQVPQLAMDASGNALAVWHQAGAEQGDWHLWANQYVVGEGWQTAAQIGTENVFHGGLAPDLAMNSEGEGFVVWNEEQKDGSWYDCVASRFSLATGWSTPEVIDSPERSSSQPRIAVDLDGNAVAVWVSSSRIYANRYQNGVWGQPELLQANIEDANEPRVVIDGQGDAQVVWRQNVDGGWSLMASRHVASEGWSTPELIETNDGANVWQDYVLASDPVGNAMVLWRQLQHGGGPHDLWANHRTAEGVWGEPALLEAQSGNVSSVPNLAMHPDGSATAVWGQQDENAVQRLHVNRYRHGIGWGEAEYVSGNNGRVYYNSWAPGLVSDSEGRAFAMWPLASRLIGVWFE